MTKRLRKLNNRIKFLEAEVIKYKCQAEFHAGIAKAALTENISLKLMLTGKAKIDFNDFVKGFRKGGEKNEIIRFINKGIGSYKS